MEQALFGLREREEVVQDLERRSLQVKVLCIRFTRILYRRSYSSWRGRNFLSLDRLCNRKDSLGKISFEITS